MGQRLTTMCSECKKVIHQGATSIYSLEISHGYCEECATKTMFLEGLDQFELEGFIYKLQSYRV